LSDARVREASAMSSSAAVDWLNPVSLIPIRMQAASSASARLIAILGMEKERMNLNPRPVGCA